MFAAACLDSTRRFFFPDCLLFRIAYDLTAAINRGPIHGHDHAPTRAPAHDHGRDPRRHDGAIRRGPTSDGRPSTGRHTSRPRLPVAHRQASADRRQAGAVHKRVPAQHRTVPECRCSRRYRPLPLPKQTSRRQARPAPKKRCVRAISWFHLGIRSVVGRNYSAADPIVVFQTCNCCCRRS